MIRSRLPFFTIAMAIAAMWTGCGNATPPASTPSPEPGPTVTPAPCAGGSECERGGCSGTMCIEPGTGLASTCEWKPEYACYQQAECKRQADGTCGWTHSPELAACLANPPNE